MNGSSLVMLLVAAIAAMAGLWLLAGAVRADTPARRTLTLMTGTMALSLGIILSIFAFGLEGGE